jgi:D-glycero-D-manno-heptose 1,7-bisphosphate phosphatase
MRVSQAVILCGGRGERLRPLTNELPKPMVSVNDRPFLQYLLEHLADNGINRFVLLTGYLSEKIVEYFGDGSSWGWSISYSNGPVEWPTTKRIHEALGQIDEQFLLLYSDNFAQLRLSELAQVNSDRNSAMTLSVVRKSPGNIQLVANSSVVKYDSSRSESSADFVEIGYSLISKNKIMACLDVHKHESFSSVIQSLTDSKQVSAVVVATGYTSISDLVRLAGTETYLRHHKILLLDRDGTLNVKPQRGEYVNSVDEFKWIKSSRDALGILGENGFSFIIISNQAGVATGATKFEDLNKINEYLRGEFLNLELRLLEIYVCTDHWNSESEFRKPNPGMFFTAANDHKFRLDHSIYVGDDIRDAVAAKNAGCKCVLISPGELIEDAGMRVESIGQSFIDLVPTIINEYESWGK